MATYDEMSPAYRRNLFEGLASLSGLHEGPKNALPNGTRYEYDPVPNRTVEVTPHGERFPVILVDGKLTRDLEKISLAQILDLVLQCINLRISITGLQQKNKRKGKNRRKTHGVALRIFRLGSNDWIIRLVFGFEQASLVALFGSELGLHRNHHRLTQDNGNSAPGWHWSATESTEATTRGLRILSSYISLFRLT